MIVTLYTEKYKSQVVLPEVCSGQFWLKALDKDNREVDFIEIDGLDGNWYIRSRDGIRWNSQETQAVKLDSDMELEGITENGNKFLVIAMVAGNINNPFTRIAVKEETIISLGRDDRSDIVFRDDRVASTLLRLKWQSREGWLLENSNPADYGVYINSRKPDIQNAKTGDCITVFGCRILLGPGFFAISDPRNRISIRSGRLAAFKNPVVDKESTEWRRGKENSYQLFYPSPRFKRDIEKAVFKIDSPPQSQMGEQMPLMMVIGPSMTMGMASLTTAIFAVNNALATGNVSGAVPSIVMSGSMVLGTVMWPILTKRYEKNRSRKKEKLRQDKYQQYINEMEDRLGETKRLQKAIREENCVELGKCIDRIHAVSRNLWERNHTQNDFLEFRVGRGNTKLDAEFKYAERHFTMEEDNLQKIMLDFCESPKTLKNVPLSISLTENAVTGIIGKERKRRDFLNGLIFQIAALYSYDEVRLVFICREDTMEYARWLPHVWNEEHTVRFIAGNVKDMKDLSAFLERECEYRQSLNEEDRENILPHYIIISDNKKLEKRSGLVERIAESKKNLGFSIVCSYPEIRDLPRECSEIIELSLDDARIFNKNDTSGRSVPFTPDIYFNEGTDELAKELSRIMLDKNEDEKKLPKLVSFLEMYNVGKIEHLNILSRWKENNPVHSLEATVGVDELGEDFRLDLHERVHGPHGLIAGMTGSGKSEFIMTYILSLAVNYHPDEVAFILIDYKGGGMAKSFQDLPHTAGIITNLDGSSIKRSLVSIESELKRRQAIFAEASGKLGISNIDIYKYQKLYREGEVAEPLQHLFIISDEFAELKTQQPDFMAKLISTARIGRSLGVHLILATQKPAGVVDDQIWSNSRFRVCLKVQEKADSMDMLKRPDAAELVDTGRFYLQVGYNEVFQIGQSAWSGAPYYPSDTVWREKEDGVEVIDAIGRVLQSVKYDKRKELYPNPEKQMDAVTAYLQKIAEQENIRIRPLWLPPMVAGLSLSMLREKYGLAKKKGFYLEPVIGELDDPENQRQAELRIPLSGDGNIAIYGNSGAGKTTWLMIFIYSLMEEHTPEEVQFYIMDFASETLRVFQDAPHTGEIMLSHEEEKIGNLFRMLKKELDKRKKVFRDFEGDFVSYNENREETYPALVVIIHNYNAFRELYEERDEGLSYLTREGTKYGIYFVLTTNSVGSIRLRLLQNISRQITLQLNDPADYGVVFGKTDGLYPAKEKGRGLICLDKLYEFQTCRVTAEESSYGYIKQYCRAYRDNWDGVQANRIAVLPDKVNAAFLYGQTDTYSLKNVPVGVDTSSMEVVSYDFSEHYISVITGTGTGYMGLTRGICRLFSHKEMSENYVFDLDNRLDIRSDAAWNVVARTKEAEPVAEELFQLVKDRNNTYKESDDPELIAGKWNQICIFITSLDKVKDALSGRGKEMLDLILEKGQAAYKINIILADELRTLQLVRYESWFKEHISGGDAIWVGNGVNDQYLVQINDNTEITRDAVSDEYAFVVKNGRADKIKVLLEGYDGEDIG